MGDPVSLLIGPLVNTVIGDATSLIKQKFHLLRGIEDQIETLISVLTSIQSVLEDAEEKQLGSKQLRDWLGKLQEAAYDAQDILAMFATEASVWQKRQQMRYSGPVTVSATKATYELDAAEKIKKLFARLVQIAKEKEDFHLDVSATPVSSYEDRNTDFRVNETDVVGREDDKNKIVDMLVLKEYDSEDNVSVIPIIGMGGLGKTTLAQLVYNDSRVKSHFKFVMWVCVTDNFDYRRILKEMIEYHTGMEYDLNSLSDRQLTFRLLEILRRQRFLLVLDDVWTESYSDWERIKSVINQGGEGCRVLVTSRTTRVSDVMGTQPPYQLDNLPEEQCWLLFEKIAFKHRNVTSRYRGDLEDIGREIVRKCKGLPLAIKAMGGILRGNNDVSKWRKIAKNDIWKAEHDSATTGKATVLPALKLSYDHLPSYLKPCFAYCYIFPKAFVFHKMGLVRYWKATSLIQSRVGCTDDEIGSDYFDNLLTRSFFTVMTADNVVTYRMHDLIHDLAQSVSSPHCFQVKDKESCSHISEKSRHVSLLCQDADQPVRDVMDRSKKLRTLVSPTEYLKDWGNVLDKLFHTSKYIRVLDLSSSTLLELPKSIGKLKLLRYLDLSKTEIRKLPDSTCSLYNLQTLKLLGCRWLFKLPNDLGKLVNLQHLELDDMFWYKSYMLPPKMGNLTSLQNLHAFPVSREKGHRIDELRDMMSLTGNLRILKLENATNTGEAKLKDKIGLKRVAYEWSSNRDGGPQDESADERILEDLEPNSDLEELDVLWYKGTRFPSWFGDGQVMNLVRVTLNRCLKCRVLSLSKLRKLRELNIKGLLELEEWKEADYNSLSRLTLSNCPKLRELPKCFLNLAVSKIKNCSSLKALPLTPSLNFLKLIDNPSLQEWNEAILLFSFLNDQGECQVQETPSFIKVLELEIKNCPMLPALPKYLAPQKLEISGCPLVSTLPTPELSMRFQHLAIDTCRDGTLVREIPDTNSMYSLVISNISSLTSLPRCPRLPGLKALYIHQCEDLLSLTDGDEEEAPFQALNSLKLLSIWGCPKLLTLPKKGLPTSLECLSIGSCSSLKFLGPNEMLKSLTALKDIHIENCPALQSLPEEGLPTSLKHLHIAGCPLLTEQCRKDTGQYWRKIMHIPDLELDSPKKEHTSSASWYHGLTRNKG